VNDAMLAARIRAGDDSALDDALREFGRYVVGVAAKVTLDWAAAEDVAQEVFVTLWSQPERFDSSRGTLRTFLGMQAHRCAIDHVRATTRRRHRELRNGAHEDLVQRPEATSTSEREIVRRELEDEVRIAMQQLPAPQRQVIEMSYLEGRTHREIAEVLQIPEGTAKSRIRLAQTRLRELLSRDLMGLLG
jgi:RNA polymerase sigma-70 factor, ECF subfamily